MEGGGCIFSKSVACTGLNGERPPASPFFFARPPSRNPNHAFFILLPTAVAPRSRIQVAGDLPTHCNRRSRKTISGGLSSSRLAFPTCFRRPTSNTGSRICTRSSPQRAPSLVRLAVAKQPCRQQLFLATSLPRPKVSSTGDSKVFFRPFIHTSGGSLLHPVATFFRRLLRGAVAHCQEQ